MVLGMVPTFAESPTGRMVARTLSDAAIRGIREGETRTDGSLPVGYGRLMIRCTKVRGTLRKAWLFRCRAGDSTIKMHLGDYPALTLEEARKRAREHIEQVKQGVDPRIAAFELRQATVEAHRERLPLVTFVSCSGQLRSVLAREGQRGHSGGRKALRSACPWSLAALGRPASSVNHAGDDSRHSCQNDQG